MRFSSTFVLAFAFLSLASCGEKPRPDHVPLADVKPRAAKFEPVLSIVQKLPASPPPVTRSYGPADAYIGSPSTPGTEPTPAPYLIIHAEDLASPPKYWTDDKIKVRISDSQVLGVCAQGLDEFKKPKGATVHKYTLLRCTEFKYAFVIRTTDYLQPKLRHAGEKIQANTRTITYGVVPGRVAGDVTIYSLADGKEVGAFQFTATSSREPSTEGGLDGALDRDLKKQADAAIREAASRARTSNAPSAPGTGRK